MSWSVQALVYSKTVGSMARKSVLAFMADRANDDGTGIWTSKQTMAAEIECSKQTVITVMRGLIADGLVREAGHRSFSNGYTVQYDLVLAEIARLPDVKGDGKGGPAPVQNLTRPNLDRSSGFTPRGQVALPKPSKNHIPLPSSDEEGAPPSGFEEGSEGQGVHGAPPDDWAPPPIDDLGEKTRALVRQWPPGAYAAICETFRLHWQGEATAKGRRRLASKAALETWLIKDHAKVMGDAKRGVSFAALVPSLTGSGPVTAQVAERRYECPRSSAIRAALAADLGERLSRQWIDPGAFVIDQRGRLLVFMGSEFQTNWLRQHHGPLIEAVARRVIGAGCAGVTFKTSKGNRDGKDEAAGTGEQDSGQGIRTHDEAAHRSGDPSGRSAGSAEAAFCP